MPDQLAFLALIKELKVYTTVDLDKEGRITMKFLPTDEVVDSLNKLMRGDKTVMVVIMPDPAIENRESIDVRKTIPTRKQRKPKG
jgi:hypothetical protein